MNDFDEIVAFFRARLDEAERTARKAIGPDNDGVWEHDGYGNVRGRSLAIYSDDHTAEQGEFIARQNPARTLRRVASGRALVRLYEEAQAELVSLAKRGVDFTAFSDAADAYANSIRLEAAVWDDHPDWKPSWRTGWMDEVLGEPLPHP